MKFPVVLGAAVASSVKMQSSQWPRFGDEFAKRPEEAAPIFVFPQDFSFGVSTTCGLTTPAPISYTVGLLNTLLSKGSADGIEAVAAPTGENVEMELLLQFNIGKCDAVIHPLIDETYTITLAENGAVTIDAPEVWGARHAAATLMGLVEYTEAGWTLPLAPGTVIEDGPRLPHRGIHVDTSRTYLPNTILKKTIAGLGVVKGSVFHWHMTDDQSYPMCLNGPSRQAVHGADCSCEGKVTMKEGTIGGIVTGKVVTERLPVRTCAGFMSPQSYYTEEEIADIIEFGELNGVRVILELDSPAHSASWFSRYREFLKMPSDVTEFAGISWAWGVPDVYQREAIFEKVFLPVFDDVMAIARPGEYIHIGGDEFNPAILGSDRIDETNAKIVEWLTALHDYVIEKTGRPVIGWDDAFLHGNLPINVQIWSDASSATTVMEGGGDIVWSPGVEMYLDCGTNSNFGYPQNNETWCGDLKSWLHVFSQTPDIDVVCDTANVVEGKECGKVLGVEAPLWADGLNEASWIPIMWTRAAAAVAGGWESRTTSLAPGRTSDDGLIYPVSNMPHFEATLLNFEYMQERLKFITGVTFNDARPQMCVGKSLDECHALIEKYWNEQNVVAEI